MRLINQIAELINSDSNSDQKDLAKKLNISQQHVSRLIKKLRKDNKIGDKIYGQRVFDVWNKNPRLSQRQIADRAGVSCAYVCKVFKRLYNEGKLERVRQGKYVQGFDRYRKNINGTSGFGSVRSVLFNLCRESGKININRMRKILNVLRKYKVEAVVEGCDLFLEKCRLREGKNEWYLYGTINKIDARLEIDNQQCREISEYIYGHNKETVSEVFEKLGENGNKKHLRQFLLTYGDESYEGAAVNVIYACQEFLKITKYKSPRNPLAFLFWLRNVIANGTYDWSYTENKYPLAKNDMWKYTDINEDVIRNCQENPIRLRRG